MYFLIISLLFLSIIVKNARSVNNFTSEYVNQSADFVLCEKCISKCCPFGEYVYNKKCVPYIENYNLPQYPVFTENIENTGKALKDYFIIIPGRFYDQEFKNAAMNRYRYGYRHYITENRTLYLKLAHTYQMWSKVAPANYCIDYQLPNKFRNTTEVRVWVTLKADEVIEATDLMKYGLIISCVFFVLVLLVYSVLPELRNLSGMILMAYVASLLSSFVLLFAVQNLKYIDNMTCIGLTAALYFSLMASFCWMNVMSCDVWWTFRGYAKTRPIHRRGECFKFCMYSLYAFGVPLGMTIFLVVVNQVDLSDYPSFITPMIPIRGCFLQKEHKLVYMYVPMLIMSFLNWAFFLMTALNIWRLSRGTAVLDSAAGGTRAAHRSQCCRFMIYLNLSVLMGLNWIFEVVSSFKPDWKIWWITDLLNLFTGMAIFLVFVCKKKIYNKLVTRGVSVIARIKGQQRWFPYSKSRSNSATDSTISQDTPLQVCVNPKGI